MQQDAATIALKLVIFQWFWVVCAVFALRLKRRHNDAMNSLKSVLVRMRSTWMSRPGLVAVVSAVVVGTLLSIPAFSFRASLDGLASRNNADEVAPYQSVYLANLMADLRSELARCVAGDEEGRARAAAHARLLYAFLDTFVAPRSVGGSALQREAKLAGDGLVDPWSPASPGQCRVAQNGLADPARMFMVELIGSASDRDSRIRVEASRVESAGGVALGWLLFVVGLFGAAVYSAGWALRARQEQVQARRHAEASERAKNEFIGMASHEILSPIHVLLASLDTVKSRGHIGAEDPVFIRLDTAAKQVADQVGDMIDFAELTAGRMRIRRKRFVMEPLVEAVLEQFEDELIEKDLHVDWAVDPSLVDAIWSDPQRIRQILTNLYSNAIKYTERGTISLSIVVLHEPSRLYIEVSDTGVGIEKEDMSAIFEPFSRLPSAPEAKGHGLGLSVVQHLVAAMQGTVSVKSEAGVGSTFVVEIPVGEEANTAARAPAAVRRLLLVEDNDMVRGPMQEALAAKGWMVHSAATFGQAKSEMSANAFDAAMVDFDLPDGSGEDVARMLRVHSPGARIVLLSGNSTIGANLDAQSFDIQLAKPASLDEVLAALA